MNEFLYCIGGPPRGVPWVMLADLSINVQGEYGKYLFT